jgi:2-C-methyl-D-erythritol 4-phosphate cytidylyltransferase
MLLKKKEYAVIVAGGKGTRLKSSIPKQFLELCGKPILLHTIEAFHSYSKEITIILVLPPSDLRTWSDIVKKFSFRIPVVLQEGGDTRFQSVKKGLEKIDGDGLVAIHDGVRPLVNSSIIATAFRIASAQGTAVAAVGLKESIRVIDNDVTRSVDRSKYRLIQTPQTFDVALIRNAYQCNEDPSLTDDASVAEKAGHKITLFEGSYENIKVTTPEDLLIAEALMKSKAAL